MVRRRAFRRQAARDASECNATNMTCGMRRPWVWTRGRFLWLQPCGCGMACRMGRFRCRTANLRCRAGRLRMLVSAWSRPPHGRGRRVSDGILVFRSKSHGYAWWRLGNEVRNGGAPQSVSVQPSVLPAETPNRLLSPVCSASHKPTSGTTATVQTRPKCYATPIFGRKAGGGARSNRPDGRPKRISDCSMR